MGKPSKTSSMSKIGKTNETYKITKRVPLKWDDTKVAKIGQFCKTGQRWQN